MCSECAAKMKKRKAKMRGIDASGFISPLALGGGVFLGKRGADYATAQVDFLDKNPLYSGLGKIIGGAVGFNPVSRLINSILPVPLMGEGLMGGFIYSGVEDTMFALNTANKGKSRSANIMNGDSDNYDWERLYNQAHEQAAGEGGRL